jgi:hypothetical protein
MNKETIALVTAHRSILLKLSRIITILETNAPDFVPLTKSVLESVSYSSPEDFTHHLQDFMYGLPEILGADYGKPKEELTGWRSDLINIWVMDTDKFLDSVTEKV